jgi:hypothetical protein
MIRAAGFPGRHMPGGVHSALALHAHPWVMHEHCLAAGRQAATEGFEPQGEDRLEATIAANDRAAPTGGHFT